MRKIICDRCGDELRKSYIHLWTNQGMCEPLDMCEKCTDAFYRFMGINTPGGGYEKLESEVAEQ